MWPSEESEIRTRMAPPSRHDPTGGRPSGTGPGLSYAGRRQRSACALPVDIFCNNERISFEFIAKHHSNPLSATAKLNSSQCC
jgi:hypothetical protein